MTSSSLPSARSALVLLTAALSFLSACGGSSSNGATVASAEVTEGAPASLDARIAQTRDAARRLYADCNAQALGEQDPEIPDEDIMVEVVILDPHRWLASVFTPCHQDLSGAYNMASSVLLLEDAPGGQPTTRFPAIGDEVSADCTLSVDQACSAMGVDLSASDEGVRLTTAFKGRGIGDTGNHAAYTWDGAGFALVAAAERSGGGLGLLIDTHPFPIVAPPSRVCRPILHVLPGGQVRLEAHHGATQDDSMFSVPEEGCTTSEPANESITCSNDGLEYDAVPDGEDWIVLRVTADPDEATGEQHGRGGHLVHRTPRGCSLEF